MNKPQTKPTPQYDCLSDRCHRKHNNIGSTPSRFERFCDGCRDILVQALMDFQNRRMLQVRNEMEGRAKLLADAFEFYGRDENISDGYKY